MFNSFLSKKKVRLRELVYVFTGFTTLKRGAPALICPKCRKHVHLRYFLQSSLRGNSHFQDRYIKRNTSTVTTH